MIWTIDSSDEECDYMMRYIDDYNTVSVSTLLNHRCAVTSQKIIQSSLKFLIFLAQLVDEFDVTLKVLMSQQII